MRIFALIILLCLPGTVFAAAAAPAVWQGPAEGQVRLVKLPSTETPYGVEFRLQFGWHTYWQLPADAGLPPRALLNGEEVPLRFPVPETISEDGMTTFGYVDRVVLPLDMPADAAGRITLDYGVCADICIPAHGELQISDGAPAVAMPLVPSPGRGAMQVKPEGTMLVLLNGVSGRVLLGVGSDYAVEAQQDNKGWAVFDLGSVAEVARALKLPLTLYRYDEAAAAHYTVHPSSGGNN